MKIREEDGRARAVMIATLAQAACDAGRDAKDGEVGRDRTRALCWIMSDADEIMSFTHCCERLDLAPSAVRKAMLANPARVGRMLYEIAFDDL